jgi:hypothetical protein
VAAEDDVGNFAIHHLLIVPEQEHGELQHMMVDTTIYLWVGQGPLDAFIQLPWGDPIAALLRQPLNAAAARMLGGAQ